VQASVDTTVATDAAAPRLRIASPTYRTYAMLLLLATCTLNYMDRGVVNILVEPIKKEFHLQNWQFGMLTGLYFALFYSFASIPIARYADRGNRARLIGACVAVWSVATVACGLGRSFAQLAAARLMVGLGEAGGTPTAQSLIADYLPREKRASAVAFYTLGIPIGGMLGLAVGGIALEHYGWRMAFIITGTPGLLLALVCALTLREPRRELGLAAVVVPRAPPLGATLKAIATNRSFVLLTLGNSVVTLGGSGASVWLPSFFLRNHAGGLASLAQWTTQHLGVQLGPVAFLGLALGVSSGVANFAGIAFSGPIVDRWARRDPNAFVTTQYRFLLLRVPLFLAAMLAPTALWSLLFLSGQWICVGLAAVPAYTSTLGLVPARMRATAAAISLLAVNLIGLGLGPVIVGALNDILAAQGLGQGPGLTWSMLIVNETLMLAGAVFIWMAKKSFVTDTVS
jgi:MFS family permease